MGPSTEGEVKKNVHILVVDDEQGIRDLWSYELGLQGFTVSTAKDGVEAIDKVKTQKFDLVISDIQMPRMDGIALLEEIKKIDPNLEVIVATGFGTIERAVSALKKGAFDFIQKPFNLSELLHLIDKALEKNSLSVIVALYESSQAVFSKVNFDELLKLVMELLQEVLKVDEASLMLFGQNNKLYIAASHGLDEEIIKQTQLVVGERIAGHIAQERKARLLLNGLKNYPEFSDIPSNNRIGSSIIIPLISRDELLGVLNISRLAGHEDFNNADLRSASIFASQVAQAVQNAKFYKELEAKVQELQKAYQDLQETQSHLAQSEKLVSIGRLVSGVAHEINNPLTSVIGYADLLIHSGVEGEIKEQLSIIFSEAQRCKKIVQDLLVFARQKDPLFETVDVKKLVEQTISVLLPEIKRNNVQVEHKIEACPPVNGDRSQLGQVLINILMNAVQALQEIQGDKKIEVTVSVRDSNSLCIVVADNGPGIEEANLKRVFDPFFSTKGVGKGTGLGLSLAFGIVRAHRGNLTLKSQKGRGATFTIELPIGISRGFQLSGEHKVELSRPKPQEPSTSLSGLRVLLVEDEENIQSFIANVLRSRGCQVDMAPDGEVGLSKLIQETFDVILCDYRIPKMDGVALFHEIKKTNPKAADAFIYVTGSTADNELDGFMTANHRLRLMKPFTVEELLAIIDKKLKEVQ